MPCSITRAIGQNRASRPKPKLHKNLSDIIAAMRQFWFRMNLPVAKDHTKTSKNLGTPKPKHFSTENGLLSAFVGTSCLLVMFAFLLVNPPVDLCAGVCLQFSNFCCSNLPVLVGLPQPWTVCRAQLGLVLAEVDFMPKQKARNLTRQPTRMEGLFRCS